MILKHYFGEKSNREMNGHMGWEYLRQDESNPVFAGGV